MSVSARPGGLSLGPSTGWGWWAVGLAMAFVASMAVFFAAVASGQRGGAAFADNLWLSIPALSAAACATLALLTSFVAVVARKERSLLVLLAMALGALVTAFWVGEIALPH